MEILRKNIRGVEIMNKFGNRSRNVSKAKIHNVIRLFFALHDPEKQIKAICIKKWAKEKFRRHSKFLDRKSVV